MMGILLIFGMIWSLIWGWIRWGIDRLACGVRSSQESPESGAESPLSSDSYQVDNCPPEQGRRTDQGLGEELLPISIIIAIHNEEALIGRLLDSLSAIEYPTWEVIFVLDRCTDQTERIITTFFPLFSYSLISLNSPPNNWSPKKWAVTQGVLAANYEHLCLTDADCVVQPDWLWRMNAGFSQGNELMLGVGLYESQPGMLGRLIRMETAFTAFQYLGAAGHGMPYMGVGRNIGYRKTVFNRVGGLESHREVLSGDDDLLVQALRGKVKTGISLTAPSFSIAPSTWSEWVGQKTRHVSSSAHYGWGSKVFLAVFHLSHALWWGFWLILLICNTLTLGQLFALYLLRISFPLLTWGRLGNWLKLSWWELPVLDFSYFLYNLSVIPWGLIRRPAWTKNRKFQKTRKKIGI